MFDNPFPTEGVFVCSDILETHLNTLTQIEFTIAQKMQSRKRRLEFAAGRYCARHALAQIPALAHTQHQSIGKNEYGAPVWPVRSCMGSITHHSTKAAAYVGLQREVQAVGIDLEQLERPVGDGFLMRVLTMEEIGEVQRKNSLWQSPIYFFSAKEAVYKSLPYRLQCHVGFQNIQIFAVDSTKFQIRLEHSNKHDIPKLYAPPDPSIRLAGVWQQNGNNLMTAVKRK